MKKPFFEHNFNVQKYVNERMLEIEDLKERTIYKELTEKILIDLFEYQTKSYETLYKKVAEELISDKVPCSIEIGLTYLAKFDASDQYLFPMDVVDIQEVVLTTEDVLQVDNPWREILYFNGTYLQLQSYLETNKILTGKIFTDAGEFPVKFHLSQEKKYLEQLKNLRKVFAANGKPWNTVCTAHLERMLAITLVPEFEIPVMGNFQKLVVEYNSDCILQKVLPLWNISRMTQTTSSYPTPALDKINYEHEIFAHRLGKNCNYLAENPEVQISSIYFRNDDLIISSRTPTPITWNLIQIAEKSKGMYEFEVFSNFYNTEFTDILKYYHRSHVKTKQELKRFLRCLPYGQELVFMDMVLQAQSDELFLNYDMDSFILDEIRHEGSRKLLILQFQSKRKNPQFDVDLLSFLVSEVQGLFPEYRCVGKIV